MLIEIFNRYYANTEEGNIVDIEESIVSTKTLIEHLKDSNTTLYKKINELQDIPNQDIDNIKSEIESIDKEIQTELSLYPVHIENVSDYVKYLTSNYANIISELSKLAEFHDIDISNVSISNLNTKLDKATDTLDMTIHIDTDIVDCPKCGHSWKPGYDEEELLKLETTKASLANTTDTQKEEVSLLKSEIEVYTKIKSVYSYLRNVLSYNDDLKRTYKFITLHPLYDINNPSTLFNTFEHLYNEIAHLEKSMELSSIKLEKERIYNKILSYKDIDIKTIDKQRSDIDSEIKSNIERIRKLTDEYNYNIRLTSKLKEKQTLIEQLRAKLKQFNKLKMNYFKSERDDLIRKKISDLKLTLSSVEEELMNWREYDNAVKRYTEELEDLTSRERVLKYILIELSPKGGLIAKSMSSFLNVLLNEMNTTIQSVWKYPMQLLPCEVDDDNDLDYKFQVVVNDSEVIPDIGLCSSSMQEMINLAFKLAYIKFKGLTNYPLILDEFGRTFDAEHRVSAYDSLERYILPEVSQVFMVSHFESMYGRFGIADISILSEEGVDTNTINTYNEVMQLEYE